MESSASVGEVKPVHWLRKPEIVWPGVGTAVVGAIAVGLVAQANNLVGQRVGEKLEVRKPVVEGADLPLVDRVADPNRQADGENWPKEGSDPAKEAAAAIAANNAGAGNSFPFPIPAGMEVPDHILDAARGMGRWVTHENGSREFVETADVKTFEAGNGWWVVTPTQVGWFDNSPIVNAAGQTLYPVGRALVLEAMVKAARADMAKPPAE